MTALKYLLSTGVAKTSEIIAFKKEDPNGYVTLLTWAREQAQNLGVVIDEA